jgi:hypothetical protein
MQGTIKMSKIQGTLATRQKYRIIDKQRIKIAKEYANLATRSELSEGEADCMGKILELAVSDKVLSFLISEIDNSIGEELHLLDDENIDNLKNKQARLMEFIGVQTEGQFPDYFNLTNYALEPSSLTSLFKISWEKKCQY